MEWFSYLEMVPFGLPPFGLSMGAGQSSSLGIIRASTLAIPAFSNRAVDRLRVIMLESDHYTTHCKVLCLEIEALPIRRNW